MALKKAIENYAKDSNGLQKAIGIFVGTIAFAVIVINAIIVSQARGIEFFSALINIYSLPLLATALLALLSGLWITRFGKWMQVCLFLATGLITASGSHSGDLTSGVFLILGIILIYQYSLGRIAAVLTLLLLLIPYPILLARALRPINGNYILTAIETLFGVFCLIILYGLVFLRHEIRHRQDKALLETRVKERTAELEEAMRELEAANAEGLVMLREIHHRVRNNLQVIISMLKLESEEASSASACLDTSIQRIYAMALVHETLYGEKRLNSLDLVRYSRDLLGGYRDCEAPNLLIEGPEPVTVDLDFAVVFGLFMNEVIALAAAEEETSGARPLVRLRLESAGAINFSLCAGESTMATAFLRELKEPARKGFIQALVGQLRGSEKPPAEGWDLCLSFPQLG